MDRRIKRTRTAVFNAVLDLMVEKDTSKITVLELCKRADINKSTFYLHYKSMDDCLQNCFQIIMNGIIDISKKINYNEIKHNPQPAVDRLLDEVEKNIEYLSKFKSSSICAPAIKMLKENIGKAEKTDIEKLKADKEETENSLEEVTEQKNSLTANISINKRIMDETQKLKTELDKRGKRYSTYLNISQTANGELSKRQKIAFEQYIQSAYFRSILNEANKRFSYMTNGRFELVKHDGDRNLKSHSGLDIDVFDNYTGKQRSVKSLSGGESFKASLCMALGLSEVIQRNAGGVKLESMFVDEGFGVLDNESLEQAIEVLNSLSESDRMVGIISHISELKDRIDKKIVVKKGSAGSTVELIN